MAAEEIAAIFLLVSAFIVVLLKRLTCRRRG